MQRVRDPGSALGDAVWSIGEPGADGAGALLRRLRLAGGAEESGDEED